ncbi:MAG: peptidylprolyl isomerase [Candidatus Diapherotrites archaeon]|nr:peptidylprolyl isomerase [Candidatus Diapherotrites archaeon]
MASKKGDILRLNYTIRDSSEVFDTTLESVAIKEGIFQKERKYEPAIFIVGMPNFFEKVDGEIEGMSIGEKRTIALEPRDAFGERNPELVRVVPLSEFKRRKVLPFPGLVVDVNGMQGKVQSVSGGRVRVDFNHQLAGKEIFFEAEVLEKVESDEKKAEALVERYFGKEKDVEVKISGKKLDLILNFDKAKNIAMRKNDFVKAALNCLSVDEINIIEKFRRVAESKT